jgi:Divergent InlB B-repeat domain
MKCLQHERACPDSPPSKGTRTEACLSALRTTGSWLAGLIVMATMTVTHAATIVVNGSDDTIHAGNCTLRAAIASMNGATLQGACVNSGAAFGTGDTINFLPAVTQITLNDTANNSLNITVNNLIISGAVGVDRSLMAVNNFRIFNHTGTGTLTLIGLDIRGGRTNANNERGGAVFSAGSLSLQNARLESNETLGTNSPGGAAHSDGAMEVVNTVVTNNVTRGNASPGGALSSFVFIQAANSTIDGNGTYGQGSNGGGISSGNGTVPALDIISTQLTRNRVENAALAHRGGGAISFGAARIANSLVANNYVAGGDGGGVFVLSGGATIEQSTFASNEAGQGGGALALFSSASNGTITNSTFAGNLVRNVSPNVGNGGAIYNLSPLSIRNSTFSGNNAGGLGGAIFNNGGSLALQSTIIANSTSQSAASPAPNVDIHSNSAITAVGANNLVRVVANVTMPAGTLASDPLLAAIADNGCFAPAGAAGTTACPTTMLLGAGSPAINAGNNSTSALYDQRGAGFARVVGAAADMGAVEVGGAAATTWPINATVAGSVGGSVLCTPNPVPNSQNATCNATPSAGYVFVAFSGDCSGAICTLTNVTSTRNVTATFALAPRANAVAPVPTLGGVAMAGFAFALLALGCAQRARTQRERCKRTA